MYSHQPKNKKIAFIISLIQSQTMVWLCKYYSLILMIAKINLLMKKLLHFIMVVKTWLHITAKHVTVIFVNFASLITIKHCIYQKSWKIENANEIHFSLSRKHWFHWEEELGYSLLLLYFTLLVAFFSCDNLLKICYLFQAMPFFMPFTPSYAIFYAIYPAAVLFFSWTLCYST